MFIKYLNAVKPLYDAALKIRTRRVIDDLNHINYC